MTSRTRYQLVSDWSEPLTLSFVINCLHPKWERRIIVIIVIVIIVITVIIAGQVLKYNPRNWKENLKSMPRSNLLVFCILNCSQHTNWSFPSVSPQRSGRILFAPPRRNGMCSVMGGITYWGGGGGTNGEDRFNTGPSNYFLFQILYWFHFVYNDLTNCVEPHVFHCKLASLQIELCDLNFISCYFFR